VSGPDATAFPRVGVGAVMVHDGRVLLIRRGKEPLRGRWVVPGGTVEPGETLQEALVREVREETGLTVARCEFFGHFSDPTRIVRYPDGNVLRIASFVYRVGVESFDGLRASEESEEVRFFARDDLSRLDVPATQRPVFERYLAGGPLPHLA
jgi:mutator protein MutT